MKTNITLKLKLAYHLKRILKRNDFRINYETLVITFNNRFNDYISFKKAQKICKYFDCQFRIINKNQLELIF